MKKVTEVREVDDLFAEVREAGVPILAPNYESFTELLAELAAAQTIAERFGIKRVPLMPSLTLSYPDRGNVAGRGGAYQDFGTPLNKRYSQKQLDEFLRLGYHVSNHDMDCFDGTSFFPNVHAIMTFDHGQPEGDRILLEDRKVLQNVGVVMYDVTEFLKKRSELKDHRAKALKTMAEATARYREKFGKYVRIESACDILPEAPAEGSLPNVEDTLTRADEMETFLSLSSADFFAPSIGTEHRAKNPEGPDKLYREPLVRQLHERVAKMPQYRKVGGKIFSLHGSSCLDPSNPKNEGLYKKLHGMVIFRYYTGMANRMGAAVKKWVEDGDRRIAANPKEGLHVNGSSGRDWFIVEQLQPELTQVMVNIGYGELGR
jgi:fructose/tagatose bisphosphate aldolase